MYRNFEEANSICVTQGGQLASIRSEAEIAEALTLMSGDPYWIGFTDADVEGQFRWIDGSDAGYTNWNVD